MNPDLSACRTHFPALAKGAIYFDNPGGTQVPRQTIDRMLAYLIESNANHGGAFPTSRESDRIIAESRQAVAHFLNAGSPQEIIFGPNMTSLAFTLSRSLAGELTPQDEIIVTRLDHDANISPWTIIAQERGCKVHWLDFDVEDCTLRLDQFESLLNEHTKLVAVGYASNAVGTINPVRRITRQAHDAGALCFVDAVQYAPHGSIDVQDIDCDFLAVSAYKFFGPHIGVLYGKREHLERLKAYKVRPAPSAPPGRFETGTQNHEGIAGLLGALEYLGAIGEQSARDEGEAGDRALRFKQALRTIQSYELNLTRTLIETLSAVPGVKIWGITDEADLDRRVPTVSFTLNEHHPRAIATELGKSGIYVWDGNYYALAVTERLGLEEHGGMVRVGLVHYNTPEEIAALGKALNHIAAVS
ncbi:MAG: cysteine desulfurase-like protein [Anaerolineales bacterium]